MKWLKWLLNILLTALALAAIPVSLSYTEHEISNQPKPEKQVQAIIARRVTVLRVKAGSYKSTIKAFGEVKAVDELSLSSEISGRVVWRKSKFVNGNRVKKGEVLIRLDDTEYKTALANAKQAVAEAKLALQLEKRQGQQAQRDWKRSGIKEKPSALLMRTPQLEVAKARYEAAKAVLVQAKRNLAQAQLKAPFAAVVLERDVAQGSYIEAGTKLATLRASDKAEISLALSADEWQQLPRNPVGMQVKLHSRDQTGVFWNGKVQRLAAVVDPRTRLRTLVVSVNKPLNLSKPLLFGSFVSAEIKGSWVSNLFAIPASALTADGYIWLVRNKELRRYRVKPKFSHSGKFFIRRGKLPKRILLVRKPMSSYLPGMKVSARIYGAKR